MADEQQQTVVRIPWSLLTILVGTMLTAVLGAVGTGWHALNSQANRITVLETQFQEHRRELERRLAEMTHKLDLILEHPAKQ